MKKICIICDGRGQIDNCSIPNMEHRRLLTIGQNPCDDCSDMDICDVDTDNPICEACNGTGTINSEVIK